MYRQFTPEQLKDMENSLRTADYMYVCISLFIGLTGFWARAYRWKYSLAHVGYDVPFGVKFGSVCITYIMNMLIPRSGEVSRAVAINKYSGVSFDKAFGTIIAERIIDLVLLVVVVGLTAVLQFDEMRNYLSAIPFEKLLFYGIIAMVLFLGSLLFFLYSKMELVRKIKIRISGLVEGSLSVFKMPNKWPFLLLSLYIWFSYVLMFWVTIYALPETSGLDFGTVFTAFVIGSIVITFTNGGWGFFPIAIAEILHVYGVPESAGNAFGWIVWTSQTAQILVLGGLSFLLLPIVYRKK